MALSLLNHFVWDIPEARIPFAVLDIVLIATLHHFDKSIKKAKENSESIAEHDHLQVIEDKEAIRAQKDKTREMKKLNMKQQKHAGNNNSAKKNNPIQQPSKNKRM